MCAAGPFLLMVILFMLLKKISETDFTERFDGLGKKRTAGCQDLQAPGWNNSVSTDETAPKWAGGKADGKCRTYKKGNYYGWGVCNSFHYGEPFYQRCEKY